MQRESVRLQGDVRREHELAVGGDAFEPAAALAFAAKNSRSGGIRPPMPMRSQ
jgi:hypothetical protein